jgi:hypothetical protein
MSRRRKNNRVLREFAHQVFDQMVEKGAFIPEEVRPDLATSIVRQWTTFDGHATLFINNWQFNLVLVQSDAADPAARCEAAPNKHAADLETTWMVDPSSFGQLFERLNVGQAADVVNRDGVALHISLNPKERRLTVETVERTPPVTTSLQEVELKIAQDLLLSRFGSSIDPKLREVLARSVAEQWFRFEGAASLFPNPRTEHHFRLTRQASGCKVRASKFDVHLDAALGELGVHPLMIAEAIERFTFGISFEYVSAAGVPAKLWHDPRARRIVQEQRPRPNSNSSPSG